MAGLNSITNIVVLMFENRSFDNIFGYLYPNGSTVNGYSFEGVPLSIKPSDSEPWTDVQPVQWNDEMITTPNPDPGEIFQDVNMQLFGSTQDGPPWPSASSLGTPPMNGFVTNYTLQSDPDGPLSLEVPRRRSWGPPGYPGAGTDAVGSDIMHCFNFGTLPVSTMLATQYAVSDQWFASVPTQTYPNRMYAHCATTWSEDLLGNYKEYYDDSDMLVLESVTNSIFQELDAQGTAGNLPNATAPYWKVYYPKNAGSFSISEKLLDYLSGSSQVVDISELAADALAGSLPLYSFIEPPYGLPDPDIGHIPIDSSYHPPYDVLQGEQFLQQVYLTLFDPSNNPDWETTLLIVTFDEHGGTYDHISPPPAPLPNAAAYTLDGNDVPANQSAPPFDRYGVRVPALLISSQIAPGTLFRASNAASGNNPASYLDHTSIMRTVFDWQFGTGAVSLTNRDQSAPNVAAVLTEATGTNTGIAASVLQAISWPPPIKSSADDLTALRAADPFTRMREAMKRQRRRK